MLNRINDILNDTNKFLRDFAAKLDKSSQANSKTLAAFDEEIKNFTGAVTESIKNLQKASGYVTASVSDIQKTCDQNNKTLVSMAENFQGVLQKNSLDIRSAFEKTNNELNTIITDSMKRINEDYDKNLAQIIKAMADNLASTLKEVVNIDYFGTSA